MGINAFTKTGNTVTFIAASTPPTPVQAKSTTLGGNQYRVINAGTSIVFLGWGNTSAEATTAANSVATSFPLLPSTDEILTFQPNAYFTGNCATTATIYITPGDGL